MSDIKYGVKNMHNGTWTDWFVGYKRYTTDINEAYKIKNAIEMAVDNWEPEVMEYYEGQR